ncbi:MAG: sulfatase family protein [Planctomycetota bacterium]|jgi:arylsulfatase A-like enzyme
MLNRGRCSFVCGHRIPHCEYRSLTTRCSTPESFSSRRTSALPLRTNRIGDILDVLDETCQMGRTLTVFTSDHGDHLGQHGMYQKMEMYEQAVRVPLIFGGSGVSQGRVGTPVSHLDLVPTLRALLGGEAGQDLDGASLRAAIESGAEPHERTLFSQYSGNYMRGDIRRAAITRRWKYVFDPDDAPELYDLEQDPLETRNLAVDPQHAETLLRLHHELAEYHRSRGDWVKYA